MTTATLERSLTQLLFGLLIGPAGFNLLKLSAWGNPLTILEQAARLTLGLTLVGTALRYLIAISSSSGAPLGSSAMKLSIVRNRDI
jgi:hypothetical protein